ncbi:unnamed protein product [Anisakis simplex]|uniref:Uncharacterized protein n=1 Tax=Anisakis simplex TaxID=6269 RepID=A0A0M3JD52_ANISI|nr:unnamed protein product [Anisakis simplex]
METETTPANEAVKSESDQPDQPRKKTKEEKKEEYKPPPLDEPLGTWRKVLKDVWVADNKDMKVRARKARLI